MQFAISGLLLIALMCRAAAAADVSLAGGEPDPNCGDLRLWLRADAGVRDAAGHGPSDPDFSGMVGAWTDQSARHFDLAALPEHLPTYIAIQPGAGGRPAVAFGGGRMLVRASDSLHDHVNSTTLLVLQIQPCKEQVNVVLCAGDLRSGGMRETLSFEHSDEADAARALLRWSMGEVHIPDPLQISADGRFAIVILRSAGENSSVEVQDGLGDALGADREVNPTGHVAVSNQCGPGFSLGGPFLGGNLLGGNLFGGRGFGGPFGGAPFGGGRRFGGRRFGQNQAGYTSYDGQIAEVMVYNRNLSSAERRKLIAYLRGKYGLDVLDALFPAGAMLLQAEDFDGPWQVNARWDSLAASCLGRRHVVSEEKQSNEGIRRTVLISRPGNYSVWVRAVNMGRGGGLRTFVGGKRLALTHAESSTTLSWQLGGRIDLPPGETEIVVRGEGPGRKECDAVLLSPAATTLAGVEETCALAMRLRQAPSPCKLAAVFEDGRRIEGNLVSGFKGSGARIAREGPVRPAVRLLLLEGAATEATPQTDAVLEFHNGDRMRGSICGYAPASTLAGESVGPQLLVQPSQEFSKVSEKPVSVEIDWLRRIVFDASGPPRRCPPRSLICLDGRLIAFRAVRFSGDGVSLLTAQGLRRLAYRDLAEIVLPPIDAWEAYHRQLAVIDPHCDAGLVRLETQQGMVFTASSTRVTSFRAEAEAAASTCLVQPAWSRTAIPLAWSAIRSEWRGPACVVPLSQFAPRRVAQRGVLGSSWKWQADRNVAGGELASGGARYLWGFGVHAPNELVFQLPDSALAFRSGLGLDSTVGDSGCVVGKVYFNDAAARSHYGNGESARAEAAPLFQSPPIMGSRTPISTGDIALSRGSSTARDLVLVVDDGRDAQPLVRNPQTHGTSGRSNADPLDIGDHADWLEPTLLLDPAKLRAAVQKFRTAAAK